MSLAQLLADRQVVICAGAGGVGKTTTAAAAALGLAVRGARVAVVTIDPARRLADALGLDTLDNEPRLIDPARFDGLDCRGELWAMTLDPKRTFDELIEMLAPSPQRAQEVKANHIYRRLSDAVAGLQEFTAVAKLYQLSRSRQFEVIVLDTPPSHNAIDFLNAPERMQSFLEGHALKAFTRPTGLGLRMLALSTAPLLAGLRRVTGIDVIGELTMFFSLLGDMTDSFAAQAREVGELLHAPETAFLVVTSPQARPVAEAIWFRRALRQRGLPFSGAIVNRVHPPVSTGQVGQNVYAAVSSALREKLTATLAEYDALVSRDATNVGRLRDALAGEPLILLDELDGEMLDIRGLLHLRAELFDE